MPVMGSSFRLRWEMVHEGVMRRSDVAEGLVMRSGMSRVGGSIFVFFFVFFLAKKRQGGKGVKGEKTEKGENGAGRFTLNVIE